MKKFTITDLQDGANFGQFVSVFTAIPDMVQMGLATGATEFLIKLEPRNAYLKNKEGQVLFSIGIQEAKPLGRPATKVEQTKKLRFTGRPPFGSRWYKGSRQEPAKITELHTLMDFPCARANDYVEVWVDHDCNVIESKLLPRFEDEARKRLRRMASGAEISLTDLATEYVDKQNKEDVEGAAAVYVLFVRQDGTLGVGAKRYANDNI